MSRGYMEKILRVTLDSGKISTETPDQEDLKKFLGGSGLATKYLFDEVGPGVDPLGPENKLIFMTGPLTGTPSPSTGRYSVVAKSPLTGLWGQANAAGFWGTAFKRSGFDGAIFEGISPDWVYLVTDDGKAELRDAKHLVGKGCTETTRLIQEEIGSDFNVACIGTAGENLVRYAAVMNDAYPWGYGRAAGRCGMGAVMGSKKLKAIACRKSIPIEVEKRDQFKQEAKKHFDWVNESILKMSLEELGTAMAVDIMNVRGGFPTDNWQLGVLPGSDNINGTAIIDNILTKRKACFACPVACGRVTKIDTPVASEGEGPEYESLGALGAMCGIDDLEAITYAHYLCNDLGLDTISTGSSIAFAMECFQKGILTIEDTDGLELDFGNKDVVIQLIPMIAAREGLGEMLALGTRDMSKRLGKGSERFAMHVKGLELPAYDPRAAKITGLAFVTSNRGGCHITAYVQGPTFLCMPFLIVEESDVGEDILVEEPKGALVVKEMEDMFAVFDSVGACKFIGLVTFAQDWASLLSYLTGWDFDVDELRKTGERIYNLERAFNAREGLTREGDVLPQRLTEEPLADGPAEGCVVDLEPLKDAYYEYRGWDLKTGNPTAEKLRELGLDIVVTGDLKA